MSQLGGVDCLEMRVQRIGPVTDRAAVASATELFLEDPRLNRRLDRDVIAGEYVYRR